MMRLTTLAIAAFLAAVAARAGAQDRILASARPHASNCPAGAPLHGGAPAGSLECTVTSMVFQGPVVRCQVRSATGAGPARQAAHSPCGSVARVSS